MNIKTFFTKALMTVAFVFLTITVAMATEVDVTVNVTGNGTVSYGNQSASNGRSFTFSAALSYYELEPVFVPHSNLLSFSITHPAGYIVYIVVVEAKKGSQNDYTRNTDETTYSYIMPYESDAISSVTLNFTFVELFRGGTESSPVILSDNSVRYLAGGWYKVSNDIQFDHPIWSYGDTYLTIPDGVTMTINTTDNYGLYDAKKGGHKLTINGGGSLSITSENNAIGAFSYEQLSGNVVLTSLNGIVTDYDVNIRGGNLTTNGGFGILVDSHNGNITISGGNVNIAADNHGLFSSGSILITGGVVNVHSNAEDGDPYFDVCCGVDLSITGGQVTADGKGIRSGENVILGCSTANDFIKASNYDVIGEATFAIADGQILQDEQGNLYAGTLTSEQIAAIANTKLTLKGQGLTLTQDQNGTSVNLQGDFSTSDENQLVISSEMKVDQLTIERTFTYNTPSSVMFPLSFDASDVDGNFYTLDEVVFENDVWTAKMSGPITQIAANTPYIFKLKDGIDKIDNLTFKNVDLQPTTPINTNGSESDWTLHGVYSKTYFDDIQGVCYGFAGAAVPEDGISVGQFVRAGEGSWVNPMRCYLTYNKNNGELTKSAPELPDYIRVVFPDEVEESESGEIVTPVSSLSETTGVKVWSSSRTIIIDAQPDTDYTIVDLSGRVLKTGITHSTREEITLSASGIVIVKIGKQTFKIIL